jgi:hypothetical protein
MKATIVKLQGKHQRSLELEHNYDDDNEMTLDNYKIDKGDRIDQ